MKKLLLFCTLFLVLPATAQVSFGVQGNLMSSQMNETLRKVIIPGNPSPVSIALEQVYGLGYGGGVHLDFDLPLILSFRVSGDYLTLSPDEGKFKTFIGTIVPGANVEYLEGGKIDLITGTVNVKFTILPIPVVKPYITGGGGLANLSTTEVKLKFNGTPTSFRLLKDQTVGTFNVGVGVDISLAGLSLYGELKVNKIFLEEVSATFLPIATVGITF